MLDKPCSKLKNSDLVPKKQSDTYILLYQIYIYVVALRKIKHGITHLGLK